MSDYDYEQAEYERLVREYNNLVRQNNALIEEIEYAERDVITLTKNIGTVASNVIPDVKYVSSKVNDADEDVTSLVNAIESLTSQYFVFKRLSTASKNLTKFNDEYFTKFKFYNELRRITLGYVIGLDSYIISNEALRKKVEKSYLSNTDYWLAYAIMSVMLWAENEKSAAQRAMEKALKMDSKKSAVFYMLVNLRFSRRDAAAKWYIYYLDRTDVNDLGVEWQQLLQANLTGALGDDPRLEATAKEYYNRIFEQTQAINAGFNMKVEERAYDFINTYLHKTEKNFPSLELFCKDYKTLKDSLSNAEKFSVVAKYYDDVMNLEEDKAENTNERIENVLYDLINAYEEKEAALIRDIKYNEAVIAAQGDVVAAQKKFDSMYGDEGKKLNSGDMLLKWAFSDNYVETDVTIKKFSISQLAKDIVEGFKTYAHKVKKEIPSEFNMDIDGCQFKCNAQNYDECTATINNYFTKNKMSFAMKDKTFIISICVCFASLFLLGIAALAIHTSAAPVLITLGIVVGIIGGLLVWLRLSNLSNQLAERSRKAIVNLSKVYEELGVWTNSINAQLQSENDLYNSVLRFSE